MSRPLRVGIVAGEVSGDLLGAGLIRSIKSRYPDAVIEGIAGDEMVKAGCKAIYPAERLSVMGLVEVLGRYRELVKIRRNLIRYFLENPPDVFVGIDAPDFNLGLESKLKAGGIPTAHYVSPSVWAWRQYRVKKIGRSIDLMLTLFPFEAAFYQKHDVPVTFVGHPLADMIPMTPDRQQARAALDLADAGPLVALLPGSRMSEIKSIGGVMLQTARWMAARRSDIRFVVPLATSRTRQAFEAQAALQTEGLNLRIVDGRSREVMAAADVIITASGTATLEALLMKRPMVVTHRVAKLTYMLASRMLNVPYVSLPNLLAGKRLVDEFLQDEAQPESIGAAALAFIESPDALAAMTAAFTEIHEQLRKGASETAAEAVLGLVVH